MNIELKITGAKGQLSVQQIEEAERCIEQPIPNEYRQFLQLYNGGRPDSKFEMPGQRKGTKEWCAIKSFLGIGLPEDTFNLDYVLNTYRDRMPARLFPIARDPGGNFIAISTGGADAGVVYFWDHEREASDGEPITERNLTKIASSFSNFLAKFDA